MLDELTTDKHRANFLLLHKQISTILRVISSTQKVHNERFNDLCIATSVNIATNFKWAHINHTLHGALHHSAELVALNGDRGLGELSEEPLEANNKDIRQFLNNLSRKCDPTLQLTDVAVRCLERSHPYTRATTTRIRPQILCSECGSDTHTVRSHHRVVGGNDRTRSYDQLVADIIG